MIKYLILALLLIATPALGDVVHYADGTFSGTTAQMPEIRLKTTAGSGVSQVTIPTNENLIYAMYPRTMQESGVTDGMNRNLGTPGFSGSTGWYRNPTTGLVTHHEATEIPFEEHAGIISIPLASATTNYFTYSELFSDASWVKTRSSVTAGEIDPMGTTKAFRLGEDQINDTHSLVVTLAEPVIADNTITTVSLFIKAGTRDWLELRIDDKDNTIASAYFNAATGEIGTTSGVSSAWISDETYNGFYRASITFMSGSKGDNFQSTVGIAASDGDRSYQGDGASYIIIFGAMVSETPSAHPYLPTEGSAYVWSGNAGALTYSLDTMETVMSTDGPGGSGTSLFGENLGAEIATGTLALGVLYKITADTGGDFYVGSAVGEYFISKGTETADANSKVKQVLNAWDSGPDSSGGLASPHFTLIQAVRHTYNRAEVPADATNHGYLTTRNNSAGTLIYRYQNGSSLVSFDGTTAAQATIDIVAHSWSWLVLEVGKPNSNVSQFRLCEISDGLSCGAWANYDGDYLITGSNLHYFFSGFGYVHFGPTLFYRGFLDSTFYDQLGSGG